MTKMADHSKTKDHSKTEHIWPSENRTCSVFEPPLYKQITNNSWILTAQYAMHVSFLSIANILVIVFVKSERALLDKYE